MTNNASYKGTSQGVKPQLEREVPARAFAAGAPRAFVVGDSVYGADHALRRVIEKSGRGYGMAVTSAQRLGFKSVAGWLEGHPGQSLAAPERR